MTTPRIYVACLAAYNNGKLHGAWIDATKGVDAIQAEIDSMLAASPEPGAEEWAIHDHEGFGSYGVSEYEDIEAIAQIAELIVEHGELFADVLAHVGGPRYLDAAINTMTENYAGAWDSLEDFAENYLEDTGELRLIPEHLRPYFDVEKYARDLALGGDVFTIRRDHKEHVFWGR